MSEINELYGYWGKMKLFDDGITTEPRMIWLGPMSRQEMKDNFPEFRHNFREFPNTDDDLLAACEAALSEMKELYNASLDVPIELCEKAIAKAKGENI